MKHKVKVIAHIEIDPEHLDFVMEVQKEAVAYTLQEKGCLEYELFQNPEEPQKITFVETWRTSEDLQAHLTTDYFIEKGKRLEGKILGKDVSVLKPVD